MARACDAAHTSMGIWRAMRLSNAAMGSLPVSKNIVVCYDGTGNEYGRNNTNVVGTFEAILRDQDQIAFYDPGIGTFSFLGRALGRRFGTMMGKAFGYGLAENIEDGYEYLMDHFLPDDKLFIFGFSRGAFTARCLVGMVCKVGILQKGSRNLIPYATEVYTTQGNEDVAEGFKRTYCHPCAPHFVGVWDTVASLGHVLAKQFPNNRLHQSVRYGYHAVSLDEQRKKFPVSLWDEADLPEGQTIDQTWFAGVHSDVGGWYTERGLSDIALIWMLEKAEAVGLRLKPDWKSSLHPDPMGIMHESRLGFWRLWRPAPRKSSRDWRKIHDSVYLRQQTGGYPRNLPKRD